MPQASGALMLADFALSGYLNGLVVTIVAVLLVLLRVLWPKEAFQRWQDKRRFRASVTEMRQGLDMLERERYADAMALFKLAAEKTPFKPAPVLLRIYTLGLQGQQRQALLELRHALNTWPVETLPKRLLALAYIGAGQYDRAYASGLAAASEEPISPAALRTLGDICRLVERYPEAERHYRQAIKAGYPEPYAGLAYVMASQGRAEEAELELLQAPDEVRNLFETQLALAHMHTQARRLDEGLRLYHSLLADHADVPRVLVPYGQALLEANRVPEAQAVLDRAVQISPEDPFAHSGLATALIERDDLANAIVHVREALRLWPRFGRARSVYGDALKRSGKYAAAEEQYREALQLNPFLDEAHARLAALLRMRHADDEAREHEREAHRLRPSHPLSMTNSMRIITSEMLAIKAAPDNVPVTRPKDPPDLDVVLKPQTPTAKRLPDRRGLPELTPAPAAQMPSLLSDIVAFPGAALLFNASHASEITQRFEAKETPDQVLAFYRAQMTTNGWQLVSEDMDSAPNGVILRYARPQQTATITIGVQPAAVAAPSVGGYPPPTTIITTLAYTL